MTQNDLTDDCWRTMARAMVDVQLRSRGIRNERVLDAMCSLPRHVFVPNLPLTEAYADRALPTADGQTISQPYMVAIMTEQLMVQPPGLKVLEIGTGSGYQAALLAKLGAIVISIERNELLAQRARKVLDAQGWSHQTKVVVADGTLGWPAGAPYDRIIVTASAPRIPQALREQLADKGRMVIPVGDLDEQNLLLLYRAGDNWTQNIVVGCRFVPLIGADGWPG